MMGAFFFALGFAETAVMMYGIFCVKPTNNIVKISVAVILAAILGGLIYSFGQTLWVLTARVLLVPFIWIMVNEGSVLRRLIIYLCTMAYLILPYMCFDVGVFQILGRTKDSDDFSYYLIRSVFTIAVVGIVSLLLKRKGIYRKQIACLETKYFALGCISAGAAFIVQKAIGDLLQGYADSALKRVVQICVIFVSLFFYLLAIGVVVLDIQKRRYREESTLKDKYLSLSREYTKTIRKNEEETRRIRHDIKSHLSVIQYLIEDNKYEKAEKYLKKIQEEQSSKIRRLPSVNHEIVDAVLLQAQNQGEKYGIIWSVDGRIPEYSGISDYDLCTVVSNLLMNSIEACARVLDKERRITIEIREFRGYWMMELSNSADRKVDITKLGRFTTKTEKKNHGYGIQNVKEAIERYGGVLTFESNENLFLTRIEMEMK